MRPHFHKVDQFQILLGEPGALFGTHPVKDFALHYVDAYLPYGPGGRAHVTEYDRPAADEVS